ncbi:CoA transferase [Sphingomonas sp. ID1715]|uniref:CaiB/BaiF CoA transferase family protein n=1 Tax=Sphingomonas sp. ID1715 TaxID=1656898 RepID=UPI001489C8AB|nr:CaiB/BaiF CoA-transferase family protein [Sphingomonas sp. ID1715]NNM76283.1 CoA transferase [Sphingomonas sp. ID1715]
MANGQGPLAGVRIVEMEAIGPVPLAAMILAGMGADIVRLVRPGSQSMGGAVLGRSRATVEADLKSEEGRQLALALLDKADAVLEGYRPGVMERLGLGPAELHARNSRLVFGRMTGWGQTGPFASMAGHDINYISLTGALHAIGRAGEPPVPPLNLVGDYGGGAMFLVTGVLAAVLRARETGQGDVVDVAMTEGTITLLSMFHAWLAAGLWQDKPEANLLDGAAHFYRCYACGDGKYVAVGCLEPQFYAACLKGLELDAADYPQHPPSRWPELARGFANRFAQKSRDEWAAIFAGTDACVTPVLSFAEAPSHPHNRSRGSFIEREGVAQAAPAPRFAHAPGTVEAPTSISAEAALARWR